MALSAKLQMRQSQSLVMTPQLLQSIRLLQYGHSELKAFLEAEAERNPLLSIQSGLAAPSDQGRMASGLPAGAAGFSGSSSSSHRQRGLASTSDFTVEDFADDRSSLFAHALQEAREATRFGKERTIGESLADSLDASGYVGMPIENIAEELGVQVSVVEEVLVRIQAEASPPGLFARDLKECLAIQLKRQNRYDPVIGAVIDNLDLLARRDFAALRRLTGEDETGLLEILAEIRALDPKPGHAFDGEGGEAIVPDVVVTEDPDGGWQVELNPETLPRVLVDKSYLSRVGPGSTDGAEKAFLGECQQSAGWLARALEQRAKTILKVATEIVKRQDGFLASGVTGMKPMTLLTVAEAIGMHESTVSRVTAMKFMATPRGTFEMRFFFTQAIAATGGGDAHSAESVKYRIKQMIDAEISGNVLSDDDIAAILKKEGIDLARRTVAKYREALSIPSSIQRRRELNARRLAS